MIVIYWWITAPHSCLNDPWYSKMLFYARLEINENWLQLETIKSIFFIICFLLKIILLKLIAGKPKNVEIFFARVIKKICWNRMTVLKKSKISIRINKIISISFILNCKKGFKWRINQVIYFDKLHKHNKKRLLNWTKK